MSDNKFFQDEAIAASSYHYDKTRIDPRYDTAIGLGSFEGDWSKALEETIETSIPRSFSTRGMSPEVIYEEADGRDPKSISDRRIDFYADKEKEFFDRVNYDYENYVIVNKTRPEHEIFQRMIDIFAFDLPRQATVHVQKTGQVFPWHLDIFQNREMYEGFDNKKVMRVMIQLTDWEPGHWFGYGNYTFTHWRAGDFHTFDVNNTPHYTANASYHPRVTLMVTGMRTKATEEFLEYARNNKTVKV
jgi:hypothetical protein